MLFPRLFPRFVALSIACVAVVVTVDACSSDAPPASSSGGGTSSGSSSSGGSGIDAAKTEDAGGDAGIDDASVDLPDVRDANTCIGELADTDASSACPATGACAAPCAKVAENYRGGIALAAGECLAKRPSCTADNVSPCIDQAVTHVCPSSTAKSYCEAFVVRCDADAGGIGAAISQDGCEELATSLNEVGRAHFKDCIEAAITAGTCRQNVVKCTENLRL